MTKPICKICKMQITESEKDYGLCSGCLAKYLSKAKRKDNGEWIYGYYALDKKAYDDVKKPYIPSIIDEDDGCWYKIDPTTLCKCTGLRDKYNKLIWERDIVKWEETGIPHFETIIWDKYQWALEYGNGKYRRSIIPVMNNLEVIGNSIDNKPFS